MTQAVTAILIKHQNLFSSNSFHISRPKVLIFSILLNKVGSFSLANKDKQDKFIISGFLLEKGPTWFNLL